MYLENVQLYDPILLCVDHKLDFWNGSQVAWTNCECSSIRVSYRTTSVFNKFPNSKAKLNRVLQMSNSVAFRYHIQYYYIPGYS